MEWRRLFGEMMRFGLLGGLSFAINVGLTVFLKEVLGATAELAFALALATVLVVNFMTCRYLVFEGASQGDRRRQLPLFVASSLVIRSLEYATFLIVHSVLGVHYLVAIVGILAVSVLMKFVFFRSVVFT